MSETPFDSTSATDLLTKILVDGRLLRIPRHPTRRDLLLAIAACFIPRRHPHSEGELNDRLLRILARMDAQVDHVTLRRYLVDCGFVRRNRTGSRYLVNFPELERVIHHPNEDHAEHIISQALQQHQNKRLARAQRRAQYQTTSEQN